MGVVATGEVQLYRGPYQNKWTQELSVITVHMHIEPHPTGKPGGGGGGGDSSHSTLHKVFLLLDYQITIQDFFTYVCK